MSQASSVVLPGVVRYPWGDAFPDVFIHASESAVKQHAAYSAAKAGDVSAAIALVSTTIDYAIVDQLRQLAQGHDPVLISVHAQESAGVNIIPQVLAGFLASHLGWPVETQVVQSNLVSHTGSGGFARLARQAAFAGAVEARSFVMVDDFIGQGGTLANLRGHLQHQGARVICATVLTGKAHSARLLLGADVLEKLRETMENSKPGGASDSDSASIVSPLPKPAISSTPSLASASGSKSTLPGQADTAASDNLVVSSVTSDPSPRALSDAEIKALRDSKQAVAAFVTRALAARPK